MSKAAYIKTINKKSSRCDMDDGSFFLIQKTPTVDRSSLGFMLYFHDQDEDLVWSKSFSTMDKIGQEISRLINNPELRYIAYLSKAT